MKKFDKDEMRKVSEEVGRALLDSTFKHVDKCDGDAMVVAILMGFNAWHDTIMKGEHKDIVDFIQLLEATVLKWSLYEVMEDE